MNRNSRILILEDNLRAQLHKDESNKAVQKEKGKEYPETAACKQKSLLGSLWHLMYLTAIIKKKELEATDFHMLPTYTDLALVKVAKTFSY